MRKTKAKLLRKQARLIEPDNMIMLETLSMNVDTGALKQQFLNPFKRKLRELKRLART